MILPAAIAAAFLLAACAVQPPAPATPEAADSREARELAELLSDTPEAQLSAARRFYEAGQLQRAAEVLEATVERRPDWAEVHRLRGHVAHARGEDALAREALARAVAGGALGADVLARLADVDRRGGRELAYLEDLRMLRMVAPNDTRWPLLLMEALIGLGRLGEAERVWSETRSAGEPGPEGWMLAGNLHLAAGRPAEAARAFETADALGSRAPGLATTLAGLWRQLGDAGQALAWYERAIAEEPSRTELYLPLAELRLERGDAAGALAAAQAATEAQAPDLAAEAWHLLSVAAWRAGDAPAARQAWDEAVRRNRRDARMDAVLGRHLLSQRAFTAAAGYLGRAARSSPDDAGLHEAWVRALIQSGEAEAARTAIAQYVRRHGLDASARDLVLALDGDAQTRVREPLSPTPPAPRR